MLIRGWCDHCCGSGNDRLPTPRLALYFVQILMIGVSQDFTQLLVGVTCGVTFGVTCDPLDTLTDALKTSIPKTRAPAIWTHLVPDQPDGQSGKIKSSKNRK